MNSPHINSQSLHFWRKFCGESLKYRSRRLYLPKEKVLRRHDLNFMHRSWIACHVIMHPLNRNQLRACFSMTLINLLSNDLVLNIWLGSICCDVKFSVGSRYIVRRIDSLCRPKAYDPGLFRLIFQTDLRWKFCFNSKPNFVFNKKSESISYKGVLSFESPSKHIDSSSGMPLTRSELYQLE